MNELNQYPIDDLIEEVKSRFDSVVIVGDKRRVKDDKEVTVKHFKGEIEDCMMLAILAQDHILTNYKSKVTTIAPEEG